MVFGFSSFINEKRRVEGVKAEQWKYESESTRRREYNGVWYHSKFNAPPYTFLSDLYIIATFSFPLKT